MPRWFVLVSLVACSANQPGVVDAGDTIDVDGPVADGGGEVEVACVDEDGDTFGTGCLAGPDCDDSNPSVSPAALEVCNRIDDDCDGATDPGCPWAASAGGPHSGFDQGMAVAAELGGSVVVTGYFGGAAIFGAGQSGEATLPLEGVGMFLARYEASGRFHWARAVDGAEGLAVAALPDVTSIVAGRFAAATATFGLGEDVETTLVNAGNRDVFVAKHDGSGSLVWAKRAGGSGYDQATGVAVLADGGVLVTGSSVGGTFGPGEGGETTVSTAGKGDIFLARLDAAGNLLWARTAGGANEDGAIAVSALSDGSAVVTGMFRETATFGAGEPGETVVTAVLGGDVFVAKYDSSGSLLWVRTALAVAQNDRGTAIVATTEGGALVTGLVAGTVTFSPGHPDEMVLETLGGNAFVARYGPAGDIEWITLARGDPSAWGEGIAMLPDGGCVVAGGFVESATFGRGEPGETILESPSDQGDAFVARFDVDGSFVWADRAGSATWNPPWAVANDVGTLSDGSPIVTGAFDVDVTFFEGQPYEVVLGQPDAIGSDIFVARFPADGPP